MTSTLMTSPERSGIAGTSHVHLRQGGVSLVLELGDGLPVVHHWGADLGELTDAELTELVRADMRQIVSNAPDERVVVSVIPEQSRGHLGTPGLEGNRAGADFSVQFHLQGWREGVLPEGAGVELVCAMVEEAAALTLTLTIQMQASGLVRMRALLTNEDAAPFATQSLMLALPVPLRAVELADFTGRHLKERTEQRNAFTIGTHQRESRRGRTGADATLLTLVGERSFSHRRGEVWGIHVGWSGNHRVIAERTPAGDAFLGAGELLLSGEVDLAQGETYESPWVYATYGEGLDELAHRFHDYLRARPHHPRSARPVTINVWEAVYYDHDIAKLSTLADLAASIGVERYVLDDGWFLGRRDDSTGLGDWVVDPDVWPEGLDPLRRHVEDLGMQFGLWVEPEMVNPDSELARQHPEWIMQTGNRMPLLSRHQQVLDLAHPEAWDHIFERLHAVIERYSLRYLKWDHNRDLIDAGHTSTGRAGVHAQTLAVYRLIDALKHRHPGLEIESCSSGGARVDLGILERTDRVWASDSIDALERQQIQRNTELLLPPELIGAHIGSPRNHSTGRVLSLNFRAGTAVGFHLGIEWDITTASDADLAHLDAWITFYKRHRSLLHRGTVVHGDHPDPAIALRGVVAENGSEALFTISTLTTSVWAPPGRITLPGLDYDATYTITVDGLTSHATDEPPVLPVAWSQQSLVMSGRSLSQVGLQLPVMFPERVVIVHCHSVTATVAHAPDGHGRS